MANVQKRPNGKWRARYRDPAGKEHARHFERKVDATRWLSTIEADMLRGAYVDPDAGRVLFADYARRWAEMQHHRESTAELVRRHLELYVIPVLGRMPIGSVRPSDVQAFVRGLAVSLQPSTINVVYSRVRAVFAAAVRDRIIVHSPCVGISLPRASRGKVEPLTTEAVLALAHAITNRFRALVVLAAGTGLRQGECLGLETKHLDFLRRTVRVEQQLVSVGSAPRLGPPKTQASLRTVPMPGVVSESMAGHLAAYPVAECGLVFTTAWGNPVWRATLSQAWTAAVRKAGLPAGTRFHDLRHYYASLLIQHGESVKVVQERLGHASAVETLNTYSHLWPSSDDRTRAAVDDVLGNAADSLRTGETG